ncbi:protein-methionine-sulfoxide reductase heme-binding subunit MsrQ [Hydrogenophaga soli]
MKPGTKWVLGLWVATPALGLLWGAVLGGLGANPAETLIRSTGDWTLRMLCVTLAVTPLRQSLRLPVLARFRRMLGLSTFAYGCLHALCYAWLDMGLDWADLWSDVVQRPFIWAGASAWLGLCVLAATSPHGVVRAMGAVWWRRVHQGVWAVALLAVLHFVWMRAGKNLMTEAWLYGLVLLALWGWRKVRKKMASTA